LIADDPNCRIELKAFHCEILNDHTALKRETDNYRAIPIVRKLDPTMVQNNYLQIRQDIQDIIYSEINRLTNDPELSYLIIRK
jgi:hypothetical protein